MKLKNIKHSSEFDHTKKSQSYWQLNTSHEGEHVLIKAFVDEYEADQLKKILGSPLVVTIEKQEHELVRQLKDDLLSQGFENYTIEEVSNTLERLLNKK